MVGVECESEPLLDAARCAGEGLALAGGFEPQPFVGGARRVVAVEDPDHQRADGRVVGDQMAQERAQDAAAPVQRIDPDRLEMPLVRRSVVTPHAVDDADHLLAVPGDDPVAVADGGPPLRLAPGGLGLRQERGRRVFERAQPNGAERFPVVFGQHLDVHARCPPVRPAVTRPNQRTSVTG
ncbi:hypothetical protein GCM10009534_30880 [Kribbella sandramycini]